MLRALLFAIIRLRDREAAQILQTLGADLDQIRIEIKRRSVTSRDGQQRGSPSLVQGRAVPLSETPWSPGAIVEPGSPDRYLS